MVGAEPGRGHGAESSRGAGGPLAKGGEIRYSRGEPGLEFARLANFSDAVYAIAMTLLAIDLRPPELPSLVENDPSELAHELWNMSDSIMIFFIAFAVMGSYWLANHRFIAGLRAVDSRLMLLVLPYLALVAFLPFPASLMGRYGGNPAAFAVFASTVAVVSFMEWTMLMRAHRADLLLESLSADELRWASMGSLAPVCWFLISIPLMWISPWVGIAAWWMNIPTGIYLDKHRPVSTGSEPEPDAP